jgi:hypothetical protein
LGFKISLALASHWAFGVGFSGVLFHILLESSVEYLKRRIMKEEIKTFAKKILGGALSGSTLLERHPEIVQ